MEAWVWGWLWAMLVCALVPAVMFLLNLRVYVEPPALKDEVVPAVSVLIPARDEAHGIGEALRCALASRGVEMEVVVMDDGSTDGTDAVVLAMASQDGRVRLERAPPLPGGWNGKQHACWSLARTARHPVLCFVDADVRLGPECVARMAMLLGERGNRLVSGFPRQVTGSFLEWMLLPLIHFVLLGFLPMAKMRKSTGPGFAAGCGQFMMVEREAYFACGGHSGIRLTMHDGLRLPRLFREHGYQTDLADLTGLASCRMYRSAGEVWSGLAKNATEGLGAPVRIVPVTLLLLLGQVVPFAVALLLSLLLLFLLPIVGVLLGAFGVDIHVTRLLPMVLGAFILGVCVVSAWLVRGVAARRFLQDWRSAVLHPVGVLLLLAVQWYALGKRVLGRPVSWKSRAYAKASD